MNCDQWFFTGIIKNKTYLDLIRFNHLCFREICIVCHSSRAWRTIAIRRLLLRPTHPDKRCMVVSWALITAIWKFTKIQMISNINFIFWNTGLPMVRSFIVYINTTNNVNLLNNTILFQTVLKIFSAFTKHRVPSFYSRNGTYSTTIWTIVWVLYILYSTVGYIDVGDEMFR